MTNDERSKLINEAEKQGISVYPRKQFTVYRSFVECMRFEDPDVQLELFWAMSNLGLNGVYPDELSPRANSLFILMKPNLESSAQKALLAKLAKGEITGNSRESKSESKSKSENDDKSESESESEPEPEEKIDSECEHDCEHETDKLEAWGGKGHGVVMLTDAQANQLLADMGLDAFDEYVERLATYILRHNVHIRSHYATIRKWYNEDCKAGV